jgi:hypothetical protein
MLDQNTLNKLMLLAYHELNDEEALKMQALIASDEKVRKEWFEINKSKEIISKHPSKPSESSLEKIMQHLRETNSLKAI